MPGLLPDGMHVQSACKRYASVRWKMTACLSGKLPNAGGESGFHELSCRRADVYNKFPKQGSRGACQ